MKALVLTAPGKLEIVDKPQPQLEGDEVLVKVKAASLNKRDQFIRDGKYPDIQLDCILGSDASGEVIEVGDSKNDNWLSKEAIINPNLGWGEYDSVQSREYAILGMPSNGTFAEYIAVKADRLAVKPEFLTAEEAAALPLGGLTAFRACFHHGKIEANDNVLISGFGGGVAQFAFLFAKAAGANVFVTSGDEHKMKQAVELGAVEAYNYKDKDWSKNLWKTKGGFNVVIDSAGGDQINSFIKMMKPAGRIVFYGATNGLPNTLDLYRMFWNQLTLQGSTMGNDKEFDEMVRFVNQHQIHPIIDSIRPFDEIISAFNHMSSNTKSGKLIIKF